MQGIFLSKFIRREKYEKENYSIGIIVCRFFFSNTVTSGIFIFNIFNLGNGNGFSVLETVEAARKVTCKKISYKITGRRKGDPACVIASSKKAQKLLGWKTQYTNVEKIIETGWRFVENL